MSTMLPSIITGIKMIDSKNALVATIALYSRTAIVIIFRMLLGYPLITDEARQAVARRSAER